MAKENANQKKKLINDMPHNLEAEQSLLGCLLLDARIQLEVASFLREEDFYSESHKLIFKGMYTLIKANQPIDLVTLSDVLDKNDTLNKVGGIAYLTELANVIPSSANYQKYLDIVRRDSLLRKIISGSMDVIDNCHQSIDKEQALAFAEKTIFDISETQDTSTMKTIGAVIPNVMQKFDELTKGTSKFHGLKTNYRDLDKMLTGLHKGNLIILAARPAFGKTSFAMNIVEQVALQGKTCAVFSLEMSAEELAQRMVCSCAGIDSKRAASGSMNRSDWIKVKQAVDKLSDAKIYIDDSAITTPAEILSKCRRIKTSAGGLDLVMIDYIQLMQGDGKRRDEGRQQEVADMSRSLKVMAKELQVPVLALSQLNRAIESRRGKPKLSDLRESGSIEQDADIVMFIHRPDKDGEENAIPNVAEIIVEKNRHGEQGSVSLLFKGSCTRFVTYDSPSPENNSVQSQEEPDVNGEQVDFSAENTNNDQMENNEESEQPLDLDAELYGKTYKKL